ncbi:MAG TPA: glycosyltransferase N-terminal domain-containing protein, partial [Gillisia sp.]|nr:glycosyltransferase N-terminal domain-containing protein [Gillisia sp.]
MNQLYNLTAKLAELAIPLSIPFNNKMRQFVEGRRESFAILERNIAREDKVIWFHMASLGEFEQGVPILQLAGKIFPKHKIVVSFFSPSGYEQKKSTPLADAVVYLPIDTKSNAQKFIDLVHPDLVIFIKYEFWPNYLKELNKRKVRTLLVSGGFRRDQLFFKSYGGWMRRSLESFEHFFVQNSASEKLLKSIGFHNVTVSGDTRFDRVVAQLAQNNKLSFIEDFLGDELCVVGGSTWPEDDELLIEFINKDDTGTKFIIAPHQIKAEGIGNLKKRITKEVVLF